MMRTYVITGTTPAAPGNAVIGTIAPNPALVAPDVVGDLSQWESMAITATMQGATGGPLDVYIQACIDDTGTLWNDVVHFAQLAAAAAPVTKRWTNCRWNAQTAPVVTGDLVIPVGAGEVVIQGEWGERLRVKVIAGALTTAGAPITIRFQPNRVYPKM